MPFDFEAVKSINEFYSDHFLESLFEGEFVKGLTTRWEEVEEESGRRGPHKKLAALAGEFFKAKARFAQAQDDEDRLAETHEINVRVVQALGYSTIQKGFELVEGPRAIPVLAAIERDGNPYLWIAESWFVDEDDSLFDRKPLKSQLSEETRNAYVRSWESWEGIFGQIFAREDPPRWVLLIAGNRAVLAERHKWGQGKYLLFDLERAIDAKRDTTRLVATFLSKDALAPDGAAVLHDQIDEKSHKHAFGVSEDLKEGLRKAVELLANEYVYYRRYVRKEATFREGDALAQTLKEECLRYLYRLLFLFYAEARGGELGIIPMNSDEYRDGYSLETLRDLEQVPLTTPEAQEGFFIDDSLRILFRIVNEGFEPLGDAHLLDRDTTFTAGFSVRGLHSPLFDMGKTTPTLMRARFRNVVMQQVIQLLSLSKPDRRRGRGRISYAQLGINQLGAVYEGILSYSGFFASETLYEVRAENADDSDQSYFVPESEIGDYREAEFVTVPDPANENRRIRKRYEKGTFIFRLAGRDRVSSASYYTPEVLTKCVVKYALKELLNPRERDPLAAEEILDLTVLEPAVGSGAFLNEAINQLADAYLERRQRETEQTIPPSDYTHERQKVKAFLAANNCYGVDLNPIASELAKVSLWLNTLYEGSATPWYGLRIAEGNSLIGCRRQIWLTVDVRDGSYRKVAPTRLALGPEWQPRPKDGIYHFLLPDDGMCDYFGDKVVKELAKDHLERIKEWKKGFVAAKWDDDDISKLRELSGLVDELWLQVIKERRDASARCHQPRNVWGADPEAGVAKEPEAQEKIAAELDEPYKASRRLKLLMDYWCALWFWPIEMAERLPSREMWLMHLEMILKGTTRGIGPNQKSLAFEGVDTEEERDFVNRYGHIDVDEYLSDERFPFHIANEVAQSMRFHHWELRFADLYADRGGFDLILGNPPWVKLEWNESGMLSDFEPLLTLRDLSAPEVANRRNEVLVRRGLLSDYLGEFTSLTGSKAFFNSLQAYPLLQGVQTNLYKLFIERAWANGSFQGIVGLLHPEGVYDDPKGGSFRQFLYPRIRSHYQFRNALFLFADVHDNMHFSVNVYHAEPGETPDFIHCANLYHPSTIEESVRHDGAGPIPGIKNESGGWELRGHLSRLIQVSRETLQLFAAVLDGLKMPALSARLASIHSREAIPILSKLSSIERRLGDIGTRVATSVMWDETNRQRDGTIRRETRFPRDTEELIISGPHIVLGNAFGKTPNEGCRHRQDYSFVDFCSVKDDFLPRTNFVPRDIATYRSRVPHWRGRPLTEQFRHVHREMAALTAERTLIAGVIPPGVAHIHMVFSIAFEDPIELALFNSLCCSIPLDFLIKVSGTDHINVGAVSALPFPLVNGVLREAIVIRWLRLVCVTRHFERLLTEVMSTLGLEEAWRQNGAAETDSERRQIFVELDALAAIALGMTEDELAACYRIQFPILRQNEREERFDLDGRSVPSEVLRFVRSMELHQNERIDPATVHLATAPITTTLFGEALRSRSKPQKTPDIHAPRLVVTQHPSLGEVGAIAWTDPKMEPRKERLYIPPFVRLDREEDMRAAYQRFAHHAEKKEVSV